MALAGADGIVLASDQCERIVSSNGQFSAKNMVRKIWVNESREIAWAYAGSEAAPVFSSRFYEKAKDLKDVSSESALLEVFDASAKATVEEYRQFAKGPWSCAVTLACGPTKKIFRHKLSLKAEEVLGGWCISGQEFNLAAFLPRRFYSPRMSVNELALLAAYSIRTAHVFDNAMVDGMDITIYRDSVGKFEFVNSAACLEQAEKLNATIRESILDGGGAIWQSINTG